MKKIVSIFNAALLATGLIAASLALSSPASAESKARFCKRNASVAVNQYWRNVYKGCGCAGPRWKSSYRRHYTYCLGVSRYETRYESRIRRKFLRYCRCY